MQRVMKPYKTNHPVPSKRCHFPPLCIRVPAPIASKCSRPPHHVHILHHPKNGQPKEWMERGMQPSGTQWGPYHMPGPGTLQMLYPHLQPHAQPRKHFYLPILKDKIMPT